MDTPSQRAVAFLTSQQQPNGSFLSYSSLDPNALGLGAAYPSIFPASLIASSLHQVTTAKPVQSKAINYLLSQRSPHWSFNYWGRGSAVSQQLPYPDDLDDTFCALSAITLHNKAGIAADALAQIVLLLTATESVEGGPYFTWLTPPTADTRWKDVDIAVNSNIAYFLALHDIHLPNLVALVESAIDTASYNSRYYPSIYPVIYFISRFYRGNKKEELTSFLLARKQDKGWDNPLHTALATASLMNLGADPLLVSNSIDYLMNEQQLEGSWLATAFCLDPVQHNIPHFAGSDALTTAFCLEAIALYQKTLDSKQKIPSQVPSDKNQTDIHQRIITNIKTRLQENGSAIQNLGELFLDHMLAGGNHHHITLLPYYAAEALGQNKKTIAENDIVTLGMFNTYGWMAYSIYDGFFDNEGDPNLLSLANVCLRELVVISNQFIPESDFGSLTRHVLDTVDGANSWEVANCHTVKDGKVVLRDIPDYSDLTQLAHKSLGHVLTPAALLLMRGYSKNSPSVTQLIRAFKHFLIARQLNDDAHDWRADLERGHINAVGALLLRQYGNNYGDVLLSNSETMQNLEHFFWQHCIEEVCTLVLGHIQEARHLFETIPEVKNPAPISTFFDTVEKIAKQTVEERKQALAFLQAYAKLPSTRL